MKHIRNLLTFFIFLFTAGHMSYAQPGCPSVYAGNDVTLNCSTPCTTLNASCLATGTTTNYTVSSIPYSPPYAYNSGTAILVNIDDTWSSVIPLPFSFCYYGNAYNQIVCGSNGVITFNTSVAGGYCSWSYSASIPSSSLFTNTIFGPYHDIDPSVSGNMYYAILGTYPCRTFVVSWYNVAMYSCNSLKATHMIVLYESTNVIEVYIKNKPTCSSWNGGRTCIGVQNIDGSAGVVAPGRNTGVWTTSNEAWRFTPSGTPNYTLTWWQGATQIGAGTSVNVCPTSATTYTAKVEYDCCVGNNVIVTDDVTVNVNNGSTVSVSPLNSTICSGQSATINASGGTSYSWSPGTGLNTTSGPTVVATPSATTTYTLTGVSSNGCTSNIPVTVNVNPNPSPYITPANPSVCPGNSTVLTGNGADSYTWSPGTYLSCTNCPTPTVTPAQNITYTVTGTSSAGCTGTTSVTVTINPTPIINITPPAPSICTGSSIGLTASGASSYTWVPSTGLSCTSCPNPTANPTTPITYTVTGTSAAGCTGSTSVTVSINPDLILGITPSNPSICQGNSVQLTANGANSYVWTPTTGLSCTNCSNPTATPNAQTTYSVTGTSTAGCTGTTSTTVSFYPNPVLSISPVSPVICFGDSIPITAYGASTYTWSPATGLSATSGTTIHASPPQTTVYTLTGTSVNGCVSTMIFTITVNPIPTSTFYVSSPNCLGNTATLTYTGSATTGANYSWNFAGGTASPGTGQGPQQLTWTSSGSYDVTLVVTENNCVSLPTSHTVLVSNISTNQPAHTNVICFGESNGTATVYPINGSTPYSYYWNSSPPQTTQTASGLPVGNYFVTITDNVGCITYDTVQVFQPSLLGINVTYENEGCTNSCDGSVNVTVNGGIQPYSYSWTGSGLHTPAITNLCAGDYTVTVTDSNHCTIIGNATLTTNYPVHADAIVDSRTIYLPMTVTFYFTGSGATDYLWDFGDGTTSNLPNPSHHFLSAGEYAVLLIINSGAPDYCSDSMYIIITVILPSKVTIPNVFTPNGDEANDRFKVESEGLETEEMLIYNRWGKQIFSWSEVGGEWDGHNANGKEEADGTYYYVYAAKGYDGKYFKFNGSVTLIR